MQNNFIIQTDFMHMTWASLVQLLFVLALCCLRVSVAFNVLPATSGDVMTGTTRNGIIIVLTSFVCFGQPAAGFEKLDALLLLELCAKEAFIGLLLGYAGATLFWAAESVGVVIDNLAGYNNVQMTNPLRGDQSTPVGNTLLQLVITLFYMLGGMTAFLATIFQTFNWWPLLDMLPEFSSFAESFVLRNTDSLFQVIVKLSSPIMLVMVLVDLAFGVLSRAAEKLEPSSLSQPMRGAIALLMLAILTATFLDQLKAQLSFSDFSASIHSIFMMPSR